MAQNPRPTGKGVEFGLDQLQEAGTPLPSRPERSRANDSEYAVPCDHVSGHADARTDLERDPWAFWGKEH
jgi:hypothetical protein